MKTRSQNQTYTQVKGGITAARGFAAAGATAGIKKSGQPDLGVVYSQVPCSAAGTFTTNAVRAASVDWNARLLPSRGLHAVCCNSGNANACTGNRGVRDVRATAAQTGALLGVAAESVLVASTGVIGEFLPMDKMAKGIRSCIPALSPSRGGDFARAIMTTDTRPKEYAIRVHLAGGDIVVGGCVKGSGMICPNMATMLGFITTDARIHPRLLRRSLREVVSWTFNNLTVDGDMSTNDLVLLMANGVSGVAVKTKADALCFRNALFDVCNNLCAKIAEDGEGATKRIEINVTGGKTYADCKRAAKAIANSNLVKTAMYGNDPNWGRILCAIGYSGARLSKPHLTLRLCGTPVFKNLRPLSFSRPSLQRALKSKVVVIDVDLGLGGKTCAVAHTCDLTYNYIKINAEYHT